MCEPVSSNCAFLALCPNDPRELVWPTAVMRRAFAPDRLAAPGFGCALSPFGQRAGEAGPLGPAGRSGENRDLLTSRLAIRGPVPLDPSRVLSPAPGKPEADRCRSLLPLMPEGQAPDIARRATYQWRARSDVHRAMGSDPPIPRPPPRAITVMTELSCERDEGRINPVRGTGITWANSTWADRRRGLGMRESPAVREGENWGEK